MMVLKMMMNYYNQMMNLDLSSNSTNGEHHDRLNCCDYYDCYGYLYHLNRLGCYKRNLYLRLVYGMRNSNYAMKQLSLEL